MNKGTQADEPRVAMGEISSCEVDAVWATDVQGRWSNQFLNRSWHLTIGNGTGDAVRASCVTDIPDMNNGAS